MPYSIYLNLDVRHLMGGWGDYATWPDSVTWCCYLMSALGQSRSIPPLRRHWPTHWSKYLHVKHYKHLPNTWLLTTRFNDIKNNPVDWKILFVNCCLFTIHELEVEIFQQTSQVHSKFKNYVIELNTAIYKYFYLQNSPLAFVYNLISEKHETQRHSFNMNIKV